MYLGIEIGGTKLQLGLGPGDGTLLGLWRGHVVPAAGSAGIRRQIQEAVPELLARTGRQRQEIRGVGIGFGGPVEDARRRVIKSHQIAGWDDFPLADWLEEVLGWPAVLGNDADVAGLAEALFGAGKGLSPIFYVTVGSGIGGGLILQGEIYRGVGRGAAEIGHLRLAWGGEGGPCRLVEEVASGWALEREARQRAATAGAAAACVLQLAGGRPENIRAQHLAEAARRGDPFAWSILRPAWECLAEALCQVIALLCPRRLILGGGVSLMGEEVFFTPLRQLVAARVFPPFRDCYDIVPAALGETSVVHGALALARRRLGSPAGN
jgi:glucokinase